MEALEHFPHFLYGLAEVGEFILLVRRAPDGLCRDAEVVAEKKVQLPSPEHEVEGKAGCCGEVVIDGGEKGKVRGVVPLLTWGRSGAAVVAADNDAACGHVTGRKEVELVGQRDGGDCGPDAAGSDRGGIVGKGLINWCTTLRLLDKPLLQNV